MNKLIYTEPAVNVMAIDNFKCLCISFQTEEQTIVDEYYDEESD